MKIKDFKQHTITRSSPKREDNYRNYKNQLANDFCNRCAYCNLHDKSITTYFEVDHFVPKKAFEDTRPELLTDYRNLVYSCKKCNVAKSGKFEGDLTEENPTNTLFYDPVEVDYNDIFYRNELGAIASDDAKGKQMIELLKLYRPIHILGWLREEINSIADKLLLALNNETDTKRKELLQDALNKMNSQYRKFDNLFTATYNDNSFKIQNYN